MERLDLIRVAHAIDRHLAELGAAVSREELKKQLAAFRTEWRDLGYAITADLCGVDSDGIPTPTRRRGRPRKASLAEAEPDVEQETEHEGVEATSH